MKSFLPSLAALSLTLCQASLSHAADDWWPATTTTALQSAGEHATELTRALREVPEAQREGMQFLIENMPEADAKSLSAAYLLANVAQAYEAMAAAPWAKDVPKEVFLNDVLPYASLNETRADSRARIRSIAAPLVKDCQTAADAAHALNQKLFGTVKVRYSTGRKKPHQNSLETMESGVATCTGLSILLVDACRAVGIPARVVGTPMWTNMRGNHTWIEIWDRGDWHFAGAAEPDGKGLNHGWFTGDAASADDSNPLHRIYASSFRRTGIEFPLPWARGSSQVNAVNVTARYTRKKSAPPAGKVRVLVRVLDKPSGQRVATPVTVTDKANPASPLAGTSSSNTADLNNILPFDLVPGHTYEISALHGSQNTDGPKSSVTLTVTDEPEQIVTVTLGK